MPAQLPSDAVQRFATGLRAVTACVTPQRLVVSPANYAGGLSHALFFPEPAVLRAASGGPSGFRLGIKLAFSSNPGDSNVRGNYGVAIQAYQFGILDHAHGELLVYHWHPDVTGSELPHLHVSASLAAQVDARTRREIALDKVHVVTGHVSLQAVVRMLITEFNGRPLRADWEERLTEPNAH